MGGLSSSSSLIRHRALPSVLLSYAFSSGWAAEVVVVDQRQAAATGDT